MGTSPHGYLGTSADMCYVVCSGVMRMRMAQGRTYISFLLLIPVWKPYTAPVAATEGFHTSVPVCVRLSFAIIRLAGSSDRLISTASTIRNQLPRAKQDAQLHLLVVGRLCGCAGDWQAVRVCRWLAGCEGVLVAGRLCGCAELP